MSSAKPPTSTADARRARSRAGHPRRRRRTGLARPPAHGRPAVGRRRRDRRDRPVRRLRELLPALAGPRARVPPAGQAGERRRDGAVGGRRPGTSPSAGTCSRSTCWATCSPVTWTAPGSSGCAIPTSPPGGSGATAGGTPAPGSRKCVSPRPAGCPTTASARANGACPPAHASACIPGNERDAGPPEANLERRSRRIDPRQTRRRSTFGPLPVLQVDSTPPGTRRVRQLGHARARAGTTDTARPLGLQEKTCPPMPGHVRQYRP